MLFVVVVEKLASSPNAAANSFRVSNVLGAESTNAAVAACTKAVVAIRVVLLPADCVVVVGLPANAISELASTAVLISALV